MIKTTFLRSLLAALVLSTLFVATNARAAVGDIYETNEGNLLRIKPAGGTPGTFATGFSNPKGLVFDGHGHLYIADAVKNAIIVFTIPDGVGTTYVSGLSSPIGVTLDIAGNLYVADSGSGNIYEFAAADKTQTTFATGAGTPAGLVFDTSGNLLWLISVGARSTEVHVCRCVQSTSCERSKSSGRGWLLTLRVTFSKPTPSRAPFSNSARMGPRPVWRRDAGRPYGIAFETSGSFIVSDNADGATLRYTADGVEVDCLPE